VKHPLLRSYVSRSWALESNCATHSEDVKVRLQETVRRIEVPARIRQNTGQVSETELGTKNNC
jgi:hypothetical protein